MEFVVALLILSLLFLAAVTTAAVYLFKAMSTALKPLQTISNQQQATVKHLANLLAAKDPLAFQQLTTVTVEPETRYNGPYLSGDDFELLEQEQAAQDALWSKIAEDLDNDGE
jgi:hypothetical protein